MVLKKRWTGYDGIQVTLPVLFDRPGFFLFFFLTTHARKSDEDSKWLFWFFKKCFQEIQDEFGARAIADNLSGQKNETMPVSLSGIFNYYVSDEHILKSQDSQLSRWDKSGSVSVGVDEKMHDMHNFM